MLKQIKNIPPNRRIWILGGILLVCTIIAYISLGLNSTAPVTVEIKRTKIVKSNYNFVYEHWKEEKLKQLREAEDFVNISETSQFKYFLKLCDWVHRQWPRSVPDPYPLRQDRGLLRPVCLCTGRCFKIPGIFQCPLRRIVEQPG
jgi:hypothetical protein